MERERNITWFIYTTDSYTNKSISKEPSEKTAHDGKTCADGVVRPLWECEGSFITKIRRCMKDLHLIFDIYKREGKYGPIKKVTFLKERVMKKVLLMFI